MLRKQICLHCLAARCSAPGLSLHTSGGVAWISVPHLGSQNGGERALPRHSSEGKAAPGAACGNTGPLFTFSFPPLWWKITLRALGWCCGPGNALAGGCPSQLTVSWLLPWRLSASTSCRLSPRGRHRPAAACLFVSYKTVPEGLTCTQSRSGPEAC